MELGSLVVRGISDELIFMPVVRALGGRCVRKRRAGLAQAENGLNLAVTSLMNFVIILPAEERSVRRSMGVGGGEEWVRSLSRVGRPLGTFPCLGRA